MAIIDNFSKEELENLVKESSSFRELSKKLGYTSTGDNNNTIRQRLNKYGISFSHFTGLSKGKIKRTEENVFCKNSSASQATLRKWFLKQPIEYKCALCGQSPFWNNKKLVLALDHIDGDNHNNMLSNLRWLCPNCHSQTETFAGKNIIYDKKKRYCIDCGKEISSKATRCIDCYAKTRQKVDHPSKEELLRIMIENKGNFSKVGQLFGVTDNAVRKWCKNYDIPSHSSDYKNDSDIVGSNPASSAIIPFV